ncbi:MAG TPA: CRISPR-associated endoribonuclease Cas6 [Thermodesulfobacteriota bacterium]|nr:CRISPR-associated endoribonuclease Cas6 [Thermodesulfobacteriota bacterium]
MTTAMNSSNDFGLVLVSRLSAVNEHSETASLKVDFREGFMSIIKGAIESSAPELYKTLFEKRTVKPYTFAVSFGNEVRVENDELFFKSPIEFKFSSNHPDILIMVYNHLLKTKEFPIRNVTFRVEHNDIIKPKRLEKNEVILRTISPILIRSHKNERHYVCPKCFNFEGDNDFEEAFKFNMDELCRNLLSLNDATEVIFNPIKLRKLVIKHMGLKLPGFVGTFSLKSDPGILNLINLVGLGSRRGQGFGMVEVVREI